MIAATIPQGPEPVRVAIPDIANLPDILSSPFSIGWFVQPLSSIAIDIFEVI